MNENCVTLETMANIVIFLPYLHIIPFCSIQSLLSSMVGFSFYFSFRYLTTEIGFISNFRPRGLNRNILF